MATATKEYLDTAGKEPRIALLINEEEANLLTAFLGDIGGYGSSVRALADGVYFAISENLKNGDPTRLNTYFENAPHNLQPKENPEVKLRKLR